MAHPRSAWSLRRGAAVAAGCLVVVFAAGVLSCRVPGRPKERLVTGVVRFYTGAVATRARVWIDGTTVQTYSDSLGRYAIPVPRDSQSVALVAVGRTIYDTCTGRVRVEVGPHGAVSDIMLTRCTPF